MATCSCPDWGGAQFSLRFILSSFDYPVQDHGLLVRLVLTVHISGVCNRDDCACAHYRLRMAEELWETLLFRGLLPYARSSCDAECLL